MHIMREFVDDAVSTQEGGTSEDNKGHWIPKVLS